MNSEVGDVAALVKEVFIDPIRTMLIVDDDYPTLDDFIATSQIPSGKKKFDETSKDVAQLNEMLLFARGRTKPWLVDVHDGRKVSQAKEVRVAKHLHHSDLMVLDYKLEGEDAGGTAAINILRELASNHHFNLVIVYTKGDGAGEVETVLSEISTGLTHAKEIFQLADSEKNALEKALAAWEDEDEQILAKLYEQISSAELVGSLNNFRKQLIDLLESAEGQQLKSILENRPGTIELNIEHLFKSLLNKRQDALRAQLSTEDLGKIQISRDEKYRWISCEKLFVLVLSKVNCPPCEFERRLTEAIVSSYPSPHRLLLTKMRTAIDQQGLIAEADILKNKHVQTAWLKDFLSSSPADVRSTISSTVSRHWDALGDVLKPDLQGFGERLRSRFQEEELNTVMIKCGLGDVGLRPEDIHKKYNSFISTKPVDRGHLTTGHIFHFSVPVSATAPNPIPGVEIQNWICLTPACDMVPGRGDKGWKKRLGKSVPFVAVRLHIVTEKIALSKATENLVLFLNIDGKIETFSIYGKDARLSENPDWEQMFAEDEGKFKDGDNFILSSLIDSGTGLSTAKFDATIVAQLRSEYALNLLQKIGSHFSRPGLGMNYKKFP